MSISDPQRNELAQRALAAREHAYAPYSRYAVGAAILGASGEIYEGVNVENAVYPVSMCAERTAVFKAVSHGERDFRAIAVATINGGSPCGSCRQVLSEFGEDIVVIQVNSDGEIVRQMTVKQLLPDAFGPADLEVD